MGMRGDGDVMAGPGHRGGPRPRGRDDAGDLGLEHAVITFALSVVMILTAVVINDLISGRGSLVYLHAAVVLGMSAAAALIAALGKWVWGPRERRAEAERVERLDRLRAEKGASLSRWMGIPAGRPLTNSDVWVWGDYTASGVTDSIAEEWYAHGYHPGVAAAALQADVDRAEVDELAAVMARVGAHDGRDRGALNDLIGWHMDIGVADVDHYAVLGRWLALPLPLVEERARQVIRSTGTRAANPALDAGTGGPKGRTRSAGCYTSWSVSRPQQQADSPTGFCSRRPDTGGLTSRHPPKATRLPRSGGSSKPLSEPPLAHDRSLPGWVVLTGAGSSWRLAWPAPSLSERLSLEGRRRRAMAGCRMLEREFPECRTPPLLAPSGP